jgi:adenine-specific DNA-methyltransferase
MNYIGSKHSLLAEIRGTLAAHGLSGAGGVFLDAFAGTTVVGQMARQLGFRTLSNDIQHYSYALQRAFLVQDGLPAFDGLLPHLGTTDAQTRAFFARTRPFGYLREEAASWLNAGTPLIRVLAWLDALPGHNGPFVDAYCEGGDAGRNYFSAENGRRCQAIRDHLEMWRRAKLVTEGEFYVLLASLLESADQVANTASVYAAFLKHVKKSARQPLTLRIPALPPKSGDGPHEAFNLDVGDLARRLNGRRIDVLYLDPPYNQRQYNSYYHILETLARWDLASFDPRGKTGLRPDGGQSSRFCSRQSAARALEDLLDRVNARHVLLSYSNEGLISEGHLREILGRRAAFAEYHEIAYKRFRADTDSATRSYRGDEVREFLFYVQMRSRDKIAS